MSAALMIIMLTTLQFLTGLGVLSMFRISLKPAMLVALSVLTGVAVHSFVPFLLQLLFIPLTQLNIFLSLMLSCALLNIRYKEVYARLKALKKAARFNIRIYEIPALLIISAIVLISVWRCFYLPPTSRDLTSGPEVIAEYAIREKTMINSVFSVNLETTNNQFKSTFITSLQIIYKYAGFPFGQWWLGTVFICFIVFLYHGVALVVHRLIAGILIVCFLAIPEMYAYSFMVLYDYSNAVYFFLGAWFAWEFVRSGHRRQVAFAGLMMGMATYVRSETLVLTGMLSAAILLHHIKVRDTWKRLAISLAWLLAPALIFYILSVNVYVNNYLPVTYKIEGLINPNLSDLRPLLNRFADINTELIFSKTGIIRYGYFIFIFVFMFIVDIFWKGLNKTQLYWLYAVLVVYTGLALLGYLLPLLDLDNSTKRGLFKIFPLMLLYMANTNLLVQLSQSIDKWETGNNVTGEALPHRIS